MSKEQNLEKTYVCPMHPEVRLPNPGKCPNCGMDLLPEGTRFAMLRHMAKSPMMLIVMLAIMVVIMAMVLM